MNPNKIITFNYLRNNNLAHVKVSDNFKQILKKVILERDLHSSLSFYKVKDKKSRKAERPPRAGSKGGNNVLKPRS